MGAKQTQRDVTFIIIICLIQEITHQVRVLGSEFEAGFAVDLVDLEFLFTFFINLLGERESLLLYLNNI